MEDISQEIKPISYLKNHTAEILKYVEDTRSPVIVTQNGEARAVILDVNSYQKTINSLNLLKLVSIGEKDVKAGKIKSNEEVFDKIQKRLFKKWKFSPFSGQMMQKILLMK